MWLFVAATGAAYNLAHVTRLLVEEVGSRAALKAEIGERTILVAFFDTREEAKAALQEILTRHEAGARVSWLG